MRWAFVVITVVVMSGYMPGYGKDTTFRERHPRLFRTWQIVGAPIYWPWKGMCVLGRWAEETHTTSALELLGAVGSVATPFVLSITR